MQIHNTTTNAESFTVAGQTGLVGPNQVVQVTVTNGTLFTWGAASATINDGSLMTLGDGPTLYAVVPPNIGAPYQNAAVNGFLHGAIIASVLMIFLGVRKAFTLGDRTYNE